MNHGRIQQDAIIEKYVHGALSPQEKESFEEHFFACTQCIQEVHQKIADKELVDRYVMGKLSEQEKEFFEEHYFACEQCFADATSARELIVGLKESARYRALAPIQPKASFVLPGWLKFFQSPVIATATAVLVLALIYPAYHGVVTVSRLQDKLSEMQQPQVNAQSYSLESIQDRSRSAITVSIPITRRNETFLLTFNISERTISTPKYSAEILDPQGQVIWREESLKGLGLYQTFTIACRSSFFRPGTYRLQVHEINPQNALIVKTFFFPFEIVLAAR